MDVKNMLRGGFIGAAALMTSACATIGYQPPVDIGRQIGGAIAPNSVPYGQVRYRLSTVENANQSNTNGCGAQAIFIDRRSGGYLHLSRNELRRLIETGQTKDRVVFTVRADQFDPSELRSAMRGVELLAARNARSGLCFGYN